MVIYNNAVHIGKAVFRDGKTHVITPDTLCFEKFIGEVTIECAIEKLKLHEYTQKHLCESLEEIGPLLRDEVEVDINNGIDVITNEYGRINSKSLRGQNGVIYFKKSDIAHIKEASVDYFACVIFTEGKVLMLNANHILEFLNDGTLQHNQYIDGKNNKHDGYSLNIKDFKRHADTIYLSKQLILFYKRGWQIWKANIPAKDKIEQLQNHFMNFASFKYGLNGVVEHEIHMA